MPDQPASLLQVIDHHRPIINADGHVRDALDCCRTRGQPLDAAREIVSEIADRAAAKRQFTRGYRKRRIDFQITFQQLKRIITRQGNAIGVDLGKIAACNQPHVRLRGDDVIARLARMMTATIQKHCPR